MLKLGDVAGVETLYTCPGVAPEPYITPCYEKGLNSAVAVAKMIQYLRGFVDIGEMYLTRVVAYMYYVIEPACTPYSY